MEETYECNDCKKQFQTSELKYEPMAYNMAINTRGVDVEEEIPKCPHCGYLAFFGFKSIDIVF